MNKDQRKYLLEAVQAQYRTEYERLKERRPREPSLNNYLVSAILDGSFTLKPEDDVRAAIAKRVRDLGRDEALVDSTDRRYTYSRRDGGTEDIVHLPALLLFDAPPQYAEALAEYTKQKAAWDCEMATLESAFKAMTLKVQLGSDDALRHLVAQADALCSLSLTATNQTLQLGAGERK